MDYLVREYIAGKTLGAPIPPKGMRCIRHPEPRASCSRMVGHSRNKILFAFLCNNLATLEEPIP
jgi:hypothetical protein